MKPEKAKELFKEYNTKWKDHHVYAHSIRAMNHAVRICKILKTKNDYGKEVAIAAKYHDIGKIVFPSWLLVEKKRFTEEDIQRFKDHVKYSYEILKIIYNDPLAKLAFYHHEKLDGSGYPRGLKGEEIPLGSRIITVCDAYDAMFRHYNLKTEEQTIQELKDGKGHHFDEKAVDALLKILKEEK